MSGNAALAAARRRRGEDPTLGKSSLTSNNKEVSFPLSEPDKVNK